LFSFFFLLACRSAINGEIMEKLGFSIVVAVEFARIQLSLFAQKAVKSEVKSTQLIKHWFIMGGERQLQYQYQYTVKNENKIQQFLGLTSY